MSFLRLREKLESSRLSKSETISIISILASKLDEFVVVKSGQTPWFSRASSKESKRTLEVPERSLGGF